MEKQIVSTVHKGGMAFTASINDHDVNIDTAVEDGGNGQGMRPKRLMLVSLAGCSGLDVVSVLNKMKVKFTDFSIDTEATLSDSHPQTYTQVKVVYKIKVAEADQPKVVKAVNLSAEKYCGVMEMFRAFAKMEIVLEYL